VWRHDGDDGGGAPLVVEEDSHTVVLEVVHMLEVVHRPVVVRMPEEVGHSRYRKLVLVHTTAEVVRMPVVVRMLVAVHTPVVVRMPVAVAARILVVLHIHLDCKH